MNFAQTPNLFVSAKRTQHLHQSISSNSQSYRRVALARFRFVSLMRKKPNCSLFFANYQSRRRDMNKNDDDVKPPARHSGKRKAAVAALDAPEDDANMLLKGQSPQEIANTLLSWLPNGATIKSSQARKMLKTFDLVRAELQHRSNVMASETIAAGGKRDLSFSGISIPLTVMFGILDFLPRYQAVHSAALVSKSWLSAVRAPQFWQVLDHGMGLRQSSTSVKNMTDLLKLLHMPQCSSLKVLDPPDKVQARKRAFEEIAKCCPMLEEINAGGSNHSNMKIDDATLLTLPSLFPNLKAIRFNMSRVTGRGVADFCRSMGDRLECLRIYEWFNCDTKLTDKHLETIGSNCPNLERFDFNFSTLDSFTTVSKVFSTQGILDLLKHCSKLKFLHLSDCADVELDVFEYIINNDCSLETLLIINHPRLYEYETLKAELESRLSSFEVLTAGEYNLRQTRLREQGKPRFIW